MSSDQYALGIIVYKWLVGERPFDGSPIEIISQQLAVPPLPLRAKTPTVAPAVEQVVMRALEKDANKRFGSVQEFALALERASQFDALTSQQAVRPAVAEEASTTLPPLKEPVVPLVSEVVFVISAVPPSSAFIVQAEPAGTIVCTYRRHLNAVRSLSWSSDGKRIVCASKDKMQTWEASTGRNVSIYCGQPAKVLSVAWSPDVYSSSLRSGYASSARGGAHVACGREDGMVQMWNTTSDREVLSYRYSAPISVVAWSPDRRRFAYGSDDKTVEVWDTMTNLKLLTFSHTDPVRVMAWSRHGKYIASDGGNTMIQVWVAP